MNTISDRKVKDFNFDKNEISSPQENKQQDQEFANELIGQEKLVQSLKGSSNLFRDQMKDVLFQTEKEQQSNKKILEPELQDEEAESYRYAS